MFLEISILSCNPDPGNFRALTFLINLNTITKIDFLGNLITLTDGSVLELTTDSIRRLDSEINIKR